MGHENPRQDALSRAPANSLLTDREGLPDWWVRLGVGLGNHADALDHAVLVHLTWSAILGSPVLSHRPATDALFVWRRHLIVLALEPHGLLGPGHLHDLEDFFEYGAVVGIDFGPVHRCAGHVVVLAQDVSPAVLVTPRKAGNE